jgi:hypothetical protein
MKRPLADMKRSSAAPNAPHEEQKVYKGLVFEILGGFMLKVFSIR